MLIIYLLGTSRDVKEEKRAELSIVTPQATSTCAQKMLRLGTLRSKMLGKFWVCILS